MNKKAITQNIWFIIGLVIGAIFFIFFFDVLFSPLWASYFSDDTNKIIDITKIEPKEIPNDILTNINKYEIEITNAILDIEENREYGKVEKNLIIALIAKTSQGNTKFISNCGSAGLIPLMPSVGAINNLKIYDNSRIIDCSNKEANLEYANRLREAIKDKTDEEIIKTDERFNPEKNTKIGTIYISQLLKEYKDERATLAAFYLSPNNINKYCKEKLSDCLRRYPELKDFITDILAYKKYLDKK